ncbi:hypothetical protein V8G54_019704 [Vigna mungo]|uniref:Apoptosis-antagonizing transcription factor C-terminal domain-containing protein n=1 Tax=Vigna mungo TaxID=3915 RepID=A0AAQ3ND18_VIGMU
MLLINANMLILLQYLLHVWLNLEYFFVSNELFHPPLEGSEGISTDLDVSKHLNDNVDQEWSQISQMHKSIACFRDKSINKWQRMTQVTTGAAAIKGKLHAFNQDISNQVSSYMRDPSRMIKQMRLRRSTVNVFGHVPEDDDDKPKETETPIDGDPELLDDSEFYQQLLKEFFETVDPSSSEKALYALKRMQPKKRKIVDRRASKSRKISVLGFVEPLCCGFENLACWHRARTFTGGVIECCCYWHRARTFTGIESLSSYVKHSEEVFILCEDSEEVFIPCGLQGK